MHKIPFLQPGDQVMLLSPSSFPAADHWKKGVEVLEKWGLQVLFTEHYLARHHGLAGTDEQRRSDLQRALDNPSIKAIFPIRGGYGASRIVDGLDFDYFQKHPKWIIGFSDITVLLMHLEAMGFPSLHGPMPNNFIQDGGELALENLHHALFGNRVTITCAGNELNKLGHAKANALGGNLSILSHLIGTKSFGSSAGKILIIEEIGERLYHVDRMLLQLKRAGIFENLAGMIIGGFTDCQETGLRIGKKPNELILEHTQDYHFPIAFDFPFGHLSDNQPIPIGQPINLLINTKNVQLTF